MMSGLSAEYLLTSGRIPNGGNAVFFRSLIVTIEVLIFGYISWRTLDPDNSWSQLSWTTFRTDIVGLAKWAAGVFSGVYLAFYARFVSQWSYLANLYNQIKQVEVQGVQDQGALAQWKAGFIEDAMDLHMVTKPGTQSIIRAWGFGSDSPPVYQAFIRHAHGGESRWLDLCELMSAKNRTYRKRK
jgi:hypothetical protein